MQRVGLESALAWLEGMVLTTRPIRLHSLYMYVYLHQAEDNLIDFSLGRYFDLRPIMPMRNNSYTSLEYKPLTIQTKADYSLRNEEFCI